MNYGELQAAFLDEFEDRSVTPSQVQRWLQQSMQRAQTLLEIPASLKTVTISVSIPGPLSTPPDMLRLESIVYNGRVLNQRDETSVRQLASAGGGCPQMYCQVGGTIFIAPLPAAGGTIELTYSADFGALVLDTDSNWLSVYRPQLVIDGAMVTGCRFFVSDMRGPDYEASFQQAIAELNAQAERDRFRNATFSPNTLIGYI